MVRYSRRGVALLLTLVLALVLFSMMKSLAYLGATNSFKSRNHLVRTGALFTIESGFADAMTQFERNIGWTQGFSSKPMTSAPGNYTVVFNTTGAPYSEFESVNNLESDTPADSAFGVGSVPARSALVVVQAEYQGYSRRAMAIVTGGSSSQVFPGFVASGKIALRGDVEISGVEDLVTGTPAEGNLYSRQTGTGEPLISWEPISPFDRAVVTGEVGVASTDASTIDFGADSTAYDVGDFTTSVTNLSNPVPDIAGEVAGHSTAPAASISPIGTTTLPGGDSYYSGDVSVDGDLVLDGSTLYVNGNLRVNGAIRGDGAVYVAGGTEFKGDARIFANQGDSVALYSKGSVKLSGFDGTEYLNNAVAGNPDAQMWWDQAQATIQDMQTLMHGNDLNQLFGDSFNQGPVSRNLELMRWTLCETYSQYGQTDTWNGYEIGVLDKLDAFIATQPDSDARDFIRTRFDELQRLVSNNGRGRNDNNPPSAGPAEIVANWVNGDRSYYGILDAAQSHGDAALMTELIALTDRFDYDRLGTSFFRGEIYTNGFVHADNDVHVIGALYAYDDGSQSPEVIGTRNLNPGDLLLDKGTKLTFNHEFLDSGSGGGGGASSVHVETWVSDF